MKITPHPLVASFSGSSGEATAANWLGRNYLRKRVIPRNPQSAAQTLVRDSMTRIVELWQSLATVEPVVPFKAAYNYAALAQALKGYNLFTKTNRALEQAASLLQLMVDPNWTAAYGGVVGPVVTFAAAAGGAGIITTTWVTTYGAGHHVHHYVRKADTNLLVTPAGFSVDETAQAASLTGLTAGATYQVYAMVIRTEGARYGPSVAASQAAGA